MRGFFYSLTAALLRGVGRKHSPGTTGRPRILVIRRNRMGDMICTLPLLQALRRHFPGAHLAVACDAAGLPIAQASPAIDEAILLRPSWNRWLAILKNARRLQGFDYVLVTKAGFDQRLALLARLTNGTRRIGYETTPASAFFTDPVTTPSGLEEMHQIEATLGLLAPLGVERALDPALDLKLSLPASALDFARAMLRHEPFAEAGRFVLINISSTARLKFSAEDFQRVLDDLVNDSQAAIGLVGLPADQPRARELAVRAGGRAAALATPGPLELAALLAKAAVFITAEGGAAHLAAAVGTPAVVLWSEGPFEKWHSRAPNHAFLRHEAGEVTISPERVRAAGARFLSA